eukprot:Selendium_serpulae@DN5831_c0_g1_i3.p1
MGNSQVTHFSKYPVYSAASDGHHLLLSGGGGGPSYGIADVTDIFTITENSQLTHVAKLEESGIIVGVSYSDASRVFAGGLLKECVILSLDDSKNSLKMVTRKKIVEGEFVKNKKSKIVDRTALSTDGLKVAVASEDLWVRVYTWHPTNPWKLEFEHNDHSADFNDVTFSDDDNMVGTQNLTFSSFRTCQIVLFLH